MTESLPTLAPGDRRQLKQLQLEALPELVQRAGPQGWRAFLNFFGATIENDNTRARTSGRSVSSSRPANRRASPSSAVSRRSWSAPT